MGKGVVNIPFVGFLSPLMGLLIHKLQLEGSVKAVHTRDWKHNFHRDAVNTQQSQCIAVQPFNTIWGTETRSSISQQVLGFRV